MFCGFLRLCCGIYKFNDVNSVVPSLKLLSSQPCNSENFLCLWKVVSNFTFIIQKKGLWGRSALLRTSFVCKNGYNKGQMLL